MYDFKYLDASWIFLPGILSVAQWTDTGRLAVIPQGFVGQYWSEPPGYSYFIFLVFLLWLSFCWFIYLQVGRVQKDRDVKYFVLIAAGLLEFALTVAFAVLWKPDIVYWTGPILMIAGYVWYARIDAKRFAQPS
jgi:hypothetical protein